MYTLYVHSKIGNRSSGRAAGKNESNFEKNIHLRKRLFFFYYWIFKCTLFRVRPRFSPFSFANPVRPSSHTPRLRVPRNKFYFHSNSRCLRVKTHGVGVFAECRITRSRTSYFRECVFRCRRSFLFFVLFVSYLYNNIMYTRVSPDARKIILTAIPRESEIVCICKCAVDRVEKKEHIYIETEKANRVAYTRYIRYLWFTSRGEGRGVGYDDHADGSRRGKVAPCTYGKRR